jgi:four helix bundle protein
VNAEVLKKRTYNFALSTIDLVDELPNSISGEILGRQLMKSATSVGANYRSACKAKSTADFINKLKIVEEEADESEYWLSLMKDSKKFKLRNVNTLLKEAGELNRIFSASARTARANKNFGAKPKTTSLESYTNK